MDLAEMSPALLRRHPWELARADSVVNLLSSGALAGLKKLRILDVGCGDGFAGRAVRESFRDAELVGVDDQLDETTALAMSRLGETFLRDATSVTGAFNVLLFLDVIEHVEDDVALLRQYVDNHAEAGATVLVTVPAFQSLSSRHDMALRHFRRYTREQLRLQLGRADLTIERDGYWFGSLLPGRAASLLIEKLRPAPSNPGAIGIGHWRGGELLTRVLRGAMSLDNRLLTKLSLLGVTIPGLSVWALCRKM